ncbi:MAG: sarcosine oxidase subunit beta family protein [Alphaproteobacteria bacterium]|nr:sarcosine oxidase subunit beta family protein [Alphaproteobacteria bacterium]
MRYSFLSLARNALTGHADWPRAWRDPPLQQRYDAVIVGGGGHGLATAYYLAKHHGLARVAVLERSWLGGGNTARNTVTIRANYLREPSMRFYAESIRLWEGLSQELNYNVMFSQRGQIDLIQSWAKLRDVKRRQASLRLIGVPFDILTPQEAQAKLPLLDLAASIRLPVLAASWHPTAGVARHDAVAWGYARAADARGVDIIQNCEVTAVRRDGGRVVGVETTRGFVAAPKVALAVAAHAGVLAATADLRLPIETVPLQAFVSEPLKPMLDVVVNIPHLATYFSQSDKGELVIGGGADGYPSYAARGSFGVVEESVGAMLSLFPALKRVRMLRQWAGSIDLCHDITPILSATPVEGLSLSVGWGSGGFKAIPIGGMALAHLVATGTPHPLAVHLSLARFDGGRPLFETAGASNRI